MPAPRNNRPAVVAATVAVLLWQLTTEVRQLVLRFLGDLPLQMFWPPSSPVSVQLVLNRGFRALHMVGLLVALAVLFVVVLLLVRVVVRRAVPSRGVVFLASWMAVVLGVFVASLVSQPIVLLAQGFPTEWWPEQIARVGWAPYWGIVVGWIAALAAALSTRPDTHLTGNPAPVAGYAGAAGYPGTNEQGAALYPGVPGGASDPSESPYAGGGPR